MPRHYYLFPGLDGPFANPLPSDEVLFRVAQISIHDLRKGLKDEDDLEGSGGEAEKGSEDSPTSGSDPDKSSRSYRVWKWKVTAILNYACRFACVELLNRVLVSSPPTEAHWDYAATKIGRIAMAFTYHIHFEAFRAGMWYSEKRMLEALVSEWLDDAKDVWRARLLHKDCEDLVQFDAKDWSLPSLVIFLDEELFLVPPDTIHQPADLAEDLHQPTSYSSRDEEQLAIWLADAFVSVSFEHGFVDNPDDGKPDLSRNERNSLVRQSANEGGTFSNREWFDRVRIKYGKIKEANLTLSVLSARANYESESNTDVKAWLAGKPRTRQAAIRITNALKEIESELNDNMS
jgi:hypothetical protein